MTGPTFQPRATLYGKARLRIRRAAAVLLLVLIAASCGDPSGLLGTVNQLQILDQFGGSLSRIYWTPQRDFFYDVLQYQDVIYVAGKIFRTGADYDAALIRLVQDGSVLNRQAFSEEQPDSTQYEESFEAIDLAFDVTGGEERLFAAGWRRANDQTDREGMVLQLRVTATGTIVDSVILLSSSLGSAGQIYDIAAGDGGVGVVGVAGNEGAQNDATFAFIPHNAATGDPDDVVRFDFGESSWFTAIQPSNSGSGRFLGAGTFIGPSDRDILLLGLDGPSGTGVAGSGLRIDLGGSDLVWGMDRIVTSEGTERYIIGGSTNSGGATNWTVVIVAWDGTGVPTVESAYLIVQDAIDDTQVRAVHAVRPGENDWDGREDLFVLVGDRNVAILMDTDGDMLWASGLSEESDINGVYNAVTSNEDRGGFLFAGVASQDPDRLAFEDGLVMWALTQDGTSFPQTEDVSSSITIGAFDLGTDVVIAGITPDPPSSNSTWTREDSYRIQGFDDIEVVAQ